MNISQGNSELPPSMYLMQILNDIAKIYIYLWEKKDKDNRLSMTWEEISKIYSKNNFRTCLRKLCGKGLLSYEENQDSLRIELVGWDDVDSE